MIKFKAKHSQMLHFHIITERTNITVFGERPGKIKTIRPLISNFIIQASIAIFIDKLDLKAKVTVLTDR